MALDPTKRRDIKVTAPKGSAWMLIPFGRKPSLKPGVFKPPPDWLKPRGPHERRWGIYDHMFAATWTAYEAFAFINGRWVEHHPAEMFNNAGLMIKAEFDRTFPDLPPLPTARL
jgi:hypothetical protein